MNLTGKVALVTGGSRGIGRAICIRLAREGAAVAINYRQGAAEADATRREIAGRSGSAISIQADISDPRAVADMYRRVTEAVGPVDILVNNAGVLRRGDLTDFDFSQMDGMRGTNVDGLVHCSRAAVEAMKQRGFGRIINLTSIAAHGTAFAGTTFYAATKAAVSVLTMRFAMELGPFGITVNAIAPGFIMTDMTQVGRTPEQVREMTERMAGKAMVRRVGQVEDVASAVAFLVSPEASFITAQVLTVDGGRMDYIGHG
jgi:3-oxoacyl-[acyl-carrier protein] reductase